MRFALSAMRKGRWPMSIQPQGEDLRKATQWIVEALTDDPGANRSELIEKACLKFDLSPLEAEFLHRNIKLKTASPKTCPE